MGGLNRRVRFFLITMAVLLAGMVSGCPKQSGGGSTTTDDADASKLEEALRAVNDAEQKLGELRSKRQGLEDELAKKKSGVE
jgi:uncharacterized protein YlxW (UPF0749 family)